MSKTEPDFSDKLLSYKTLVQEMPEIAYVFDDEGRLLFWNKNIEIILGYTKEELLYKNILEFIDIDDREHVLKAFNDILEGNERPAEYNMLTKAGEKLPYIGSGTLTVISGKQYVVGQAINTSILKHIEKSFESSDPAKENTLIEIEKKHILETLNKTNWRISGARGAARILAIHPETLRSRMRKLGIKRPVK
jgi:PAS domain S-box-containing protein